MHHKNFNNIQSLIKVTKTLTSPITGEVTLSKQYLMANFKTTAKEFHQKILQHWRVETYHYHLDMLTEEDDHIAYKEPFSIAILRSFLSISIKYFSMPIKIKKCFLLVKP